MLKDGSLTKYKKAGKIASQVRGLVRSLVKPGIPIIEICETIEKNIVSRGGKPAFPCNVCVNEVAAHYSSPPGDTQLIPHEGLVKVDIGVNVDGYIADTATTISLNHEYKGMVYAVEQALDQAIKAIRPDIKTTSIGSVIQKTIKRFGFKPIWNLSGHQMKRYLLHTGKSIPNVSRFTVSKIRESEVYAVEPFLTLASGTGEVHGINEAYIFRYHRSKTRNPKASALIDYIKKEFRALPFSQRWFKSMLKRDESQQIFKELVEKKSITAYPVLVEKSQQIVAQAEHTIIVTKTGCIVTTL